MQDLSGKVIGLWSVLDRYIKNERGERKWLCRCACGTERYVLERSLLHGGSRSCGCRSIKPYASADITGERFYRLIALYPTEKRSEKGSVIWHCRCDCGNEVDISYNELVYSNRKSCGCQKKEHEEQLSRCLSHEAGTTIDLLRSDKIPVNNTTGVRGVYRIRGKYTAKIVFQKKAYYLGSYERIEQAAEARKQAEKKLFQEVVNYHTDYKNAAELAPDWARENPMQVKVRKSEQSEFYVVFIPSIKAVQEVIKERQQMKWSQI